MQTQITEILYDQNSKRILEIGTRYVLAVYSLTNPRKFRSHKSISDGSDLFPLPEIGTAKHVRHLYT